MSCLGCCSMDSIEGIPKQFGVKDGGGEPLGSDPVSRARPGADKATAGDYLLDVVARESFPEEVPQVESHPQGGDSDSGPRLPGSPTHDAALGLEELKRVSASPTARSPLTPRSPCVVRTSSLPSSPDLGAAAQLHPNMYVGHSSGSLERLLGPSLRNSLSCSSFPLPGQSHLPSGSPEPWPPYHAFRQHLLQPPLAVDRYRAAEAHMQWVPAKSPPDFTGPLTALDAHQGMQPSASLHKAEPWVVCT